MGYRILTSSGAIKTTGASGSTPNIELLNTGELDVGKILVPDGVGGVNWVDGAPVTVTTQTTDNSNVVIATIPVVDPSTVTLTAIASARQSGGSGRAGYRRRAMFYRDGGGATIQGGIQTNFTRESIAGWNFTFQTNANDIEIIVNGNGGQTVDWVVRYQIVEAP